MHSHSTCTYTQATDVTCHPPSLVGLPLLCCGKSQTHVHMTDTFHLHVHTDDGRDVPSSIPRRVTTPLLQQVTDTCTHAFTFHLHVHTDDGRDVPSSIPRRVTTPLLWQVTDTWHVAKRMGDVPGPLIAAALIPGIIIAILFWFDHGVSIKLGMPKVSVCICVCAYVVM